MNFSVTPSEFMIMMLVVLAATALLAEKIRVAYPILLVLAGLFMGVVPVFFPSMPRIRANPDIVFLTFLPPLLYYAGLLTSWRDFKANIRPISELAIGLVVATMFAVAAVAHYCIPGMTWAASLLLGAIVSPPDAVAAAAVLEKLRVPKKLSTILEGESMVNDVTALVAYQITLPMALVAGLSFSYRGMAWNIIWDPAIGLAIGLGAAWCCAKLLEKIEAPAVESTLALLVPYAAYIPANKLGASGVLAAVAAGIYMGRRMPQIGSPKQRIRAFAVWENLVFLLNGIIFILIGLQLYDIVVALSNIRLSSLVWYAALVSATAIVVRLAYVFPAAYLPRLIPAVRRAEPEAPHWKTVAVISWSGMRGIVTLAAALALSDALPQKNMILFLSFGVILATLVFQGLTLSPLIQLLGLKQDHEQERQEEIQARLDAAHAAISRLSILDLEEDVDPAALDRVRAEYGERIISLGGNPTDPLDAAQASCEKSVRFIRHEALIAERKMITFMRDQNILGDEILRRILVEIDLEEAKLIGK